MEVLKPQPYDPLDYEHLAENVVRALMERPCEPLPPTPFEGAGVYALYYNGDLEYYRPIRGESMPIYVGSAVPPGKRKGSKEDDKSARPLHRRLQEHAKSIRQAGNLKLAEFTCRYIVVVPVWIELAERFLIEHYRPVWNTSVDGFGNHPPGAGRKDMKRPRWDIVHPGRDWAGKLRATETSEEILEKLELPPEAGS